MAMTTMVCNIKYTKSIQYQYNRELYLKGLTLKIFLNRIEREKEKQWQEHKCKIINHLCINNHQVLCCSIIFHHLEIQNST